MAHSESFRFILTNAGDAQIERDAPPTQPGRRNTMNEQSSPYRIRVMIVDDLAVVRSGLKIFMQAFEDLKLVGEATNGEEAVALCVRLNPDVVLIDLDMPGMCSVAAMQLMRYQCPGAQIVAMSSFQGDRKLQNMLANGAIGCLLKNVSPDELVNTIRSAFVRPRRDHEAIEPAFTAMPNLPCKGTSCPWGWRCTPLKAEDSRFCSNTHPA